MFYSGRCFRENVLEVFRAQPDIPMQLTLGQAVKHARVSTSSLSKLIRTGKITAACQPYSAFQIDPSELDSSPCSFSRTYGTQAMCTVRYLGKYGLEYKCKALMLLLYDREHHIQDVRQARLDAGNRDEPRARNAYLQQSTGDS